MEMNANQCQSKPKSIDLRVVITDDDVDKFLYIEKQFCLKSHTHALRALIRKHYQILKKKEDQE